jgi:hypothetical protein
MAIVIVVGSGTETYGLWCPHCLKPSVIQVPLHSLSLSGVSPLATLRKCVDCGAQVPGPEPS